MITSGSRSPKNDSRYARRRSIVKGNRKQLQDVIGALKNATDKVVFEEFHEQKSTHSAIADFKQSWGLGVQIHDRSGVMPVRSPNLKDAGIRTDRIPNAELKGDFRLMIADLTMMKTRFTGGASNGYIAVFVGKNRLELIASKWGTGKAGHHFYHWQAVARGANLNLVAPVDDHSSRDDDSDDQDSKRQQVMKNLGEALPFFS